MLSSPVRSIRDIIFHDSTLRVILLWQQDSFSGSCSPLLIIGAAAKRALVANFLSIPFPAAAAYFLRSRQESREDKAYNTTPPSPPASMHGGGEVSFLRCSEEETEILREKNRRKKRKTANLRGSLGVRRYALSNRKNTVMKAFSCQQCICNTKKKTFLPALEGILAGKGFNLQLYAVDG